MRWLEKMPVIPLARAVPVRFLDPKWTPAVVQEVCDEGRADHWWRGDGYGDPGYRVDLEDPQGMAYALRWLATRCPCPSAVLRRFWQGETTDEDRMTVAITCLEITKEKTYED